ncbi:hypothetical protein [Escherichia coli]|nr:hypothetical protein [Escherichia coli]
MERASKMPPSYLYDQ